MNKSTVKFQSRATWTHVYCRRNGASWRLSVNSVSAALSFCALKAGSCSWIRGPKRCLGVKFGSEGPPAYKGIEDAFELRPAVVEFFEYVRGVDDGEIFCLNVRWGIPFLMEIKYRPDMSKGPTERG
jgi:hypothetical protein